MIHWVFVLYMLAGGAWMPIERIDGGPTQAACVQKKIEFSRLYPLPHYQLSLCQPDHMTIPEVPQ